MKVSAINSFSPSVNFEKRERKANEVSRGHQTNPMKAVPLAVLIAMSPLNSVDTKAQDIQVRTEQTSNSNKNTRDYYIVAYYQYENPNCYIEFLGDRPGGDYSLARLNFKETKNIPPIRDENGVLHEAEQTTEKTVVLTGLAIDSVDVYPSEYSSLLDKDTLFVLHYMVGNGTKKIMPPVDKNTKKQINPNKKPIELDLESADYAIPEHFYEDLKETMGDRIKYYSKRKKAWF